MRDTPAMLRELNVVEQRYQAVLEVLDGTPVTEVAQRFGVARQTERRWVARYRESGLDGLADRSHAPPAHPWRVSAEIEAVICDLRTAHRSWGPRRLAFELERRGHPGVSRSTVYRAPAADGLGLRIPAELTRKPQPPAGAEEPEPADRAAAPPRQRQRAWQGRRAGPGSPSVGQPLDRGTAGVARARDDRAHRLALGRSQPGSCPARRPPDQDPAVPARRP